VVFSHRNKNATESTELNPVLFRAFHGVFFNNSWNWWRFFMKPQWCLLYLIVAALLGLPLAAAGGDVTLAWDLVTSPALAGYQLCYGNASGQYGTVVDVGNVTTYTVSNLAAGTYYFAVKAYGSAGQQSAFSNEVTTIISAPADTTPPAISNVVISNLTVSSAIISWTTNEASDSQIEYGTTAAYGSSTSLNSSLVTSHSQALSGLTPGTLYHHRVKSKDAAGNLAASGDYTFTTATLPDTTPPVISAVSSSGIGTTGAIISWTTDEPSDSKVQYGTTIGYGSSTPLDSSLVTSHSQALSGLTPRTLYHYRVKSKDAAGNLAASGDYTFTTATPSVTPPSTSGSVTALPRFSAGQNVLGVGTMAGMAIANLSFAPAILTFTAIEDDGNLTTGQNISNPVTLVLNPGAQLPIIDWQIFGNGLSSLNSNGWIKLESTSAGTNGFFLILDSTQRLMDGANLAHTKMTDFVFTEIQADGYNKISVINDNSEDADVTLNLIKADGTLRASKSRVISSNGALTADLFSDLFTGANPDAGDYVRVHSSKGLKSFQVMRQKSGDIAALSGQDAAAGGTTVYSPQYVVGGNYRTSLSIINLDSRAGTAILRFVGEDGIQMGATRAVAMPANGKLYIDDPQFFLMLDPNVQTAGYVEIVSDGIRLAGSAVFGDSNGSGFFSALALISSLQTSVLFNHVASNDLYFTGIAILNPSATTYAAVAIELYAADGTLLQWGTQMIGARQRQARVLTEYFPSLQGQNQASGYVRLTSDQPIASFALFGTQSLSVLAAIPPQEQ
jgi:hypothetical protein